MSAKRHERSFAREAALSLLYSGDIAESDLEEVINEGLYPSDDLEVSEYAEFLVLGVVEHRDEIDGRLVAVSENWAIDRMPVVDRAILRLATFEMLFSDDVPVSVSINEAVELAKKYGGEDDSSRFVNGVLGRIARTMEAAEEGTAEAAEETAAEVAAESTGSAEEVAQEAAPEVTAEDRAETTAEGASTDEC